MPFCAAIKADGEACLKHANDGDMFCRLHRTVEQRRRQARAMRQVWFDVLDALWGENPDTIQPLEMIIARALIDGVVDEEMAAVLLDDLDDEWNWYLRFRPRTTIQPKSDLHALTLDTQNVHTKVVATQTNVGMEVLLNMPIPESQHTMNEIKEAWGDRRRSKTVRKDMKAWYRKSECREPDDHLYRRLLDGLWARIQIHEHKTELIERLWEECVESVKMCCEGHLSRLSSVLVGFDADAKQEVPVGERLQQAMSVIAEKDIPVEHKVIEAWAVFEELKIPTDQRMPWVDAL